jgi:hypothetical protein
MRGYELLRLLPSFPAVRDPGSSVSGYAAKLAAALVAITKAPSGYSSWCHPDRLAKRITVLLAPLPEQNASSAFDGLLPPTADACRAS